MWPSSPVPAFCLRVWCVAGLLLAIHFVLLPAEAGISAVHVQLSGLQDCSCTLVMVPASFSQLRRYNSPTLITEALIVTLTLRTATHNTLTHEDAPPYQVWSQRIEQFRRYCLAKIRTDKHGDPNIPTPHFFCSEGDNEQQSVALVQRPCSMNNPVFLLFSDTGSVAMFYE